MGDFIEIKDFNIPVALKQYLSRAGSEQTDKSVIEREIANAESYVKLKIAGIYTLPLSDAEETKFIKWATEKIAIYYLYGSNPGIAMPDSAILMYDNAVLELNAVRDRKQGIGLDKTEDMAAKETSVGRIVRR